MNEHFKQLKIRRPDGSAAYETVADVEGLIMIALSVKMSGDGNPRVDALLAWVAALGRIPTAAEFTRWMEGIGARFVAMPGTVEDHEN